MKEEMGVLVVVVFVIIIKKKFKMKCLDEL